MRRVAMFLAVLQCVMLAGCDEQERGITQDFLGEYAKQIEGSKEEIIGGLNWIQDTVKEVIENANND